MQDHGHLATSSVCLHIVSLEDIGYNYSLGCFLRPGSVTSQLTRWQLPNQMYPFVILIFLSELTNQHLPLRCHFIDTTI